MKVVYGVPWVEIEFGSRPEGWELFRDKKECIKVTKESSEKGAYDGGYCGPERPLRFFEIPFDSLPDELIEKFENTDVISTDNFWSPKFRDNGTSIE